MAQGEMSGWEGDCLACDPFDGDFGGGGENDGVLSDKIVTCRKPGECHTCAGQSEKGSRVRRRAEVYDGEFMRFLWCTDCCIAMADEGGWDEGKGRWFDPYEDRIALGKERRDVLASRPQSEKA